MTADHSLRRLRRLLARRHATRRKDLARLAAAAQEARAAALAEARVRHLLAETSASAGPAHARDLAARGTLVGLLAPALEAAHGRAASAAARLTEQRSTAARSAEACRILADRLAQRRHLLAAERLERAQRDLPTRNRRP
ncbi:MAG: hypothetical protein NZM40_06190 [Sphingomonadaceae bacterium]|uniref:hypothetical protein n=1 Tax=Thermaurantiacus sp. TaxID=2820283 RepID=UPI00298F2EAD|nr:hypothetical protein [Thermaurantiacus sp.]MCS6987009.1 hypothetical protein [Sphingomonadaceae bacterium]MDW8415653.1 hypothetical protein [Thermaurantiacus sp.]